MRAEFQKKVKVMMNLMKRMPRELLLVLRYAFGSAPSSGTYGVPLRNQNYLRALNKELGEPVNRFTLMARVAVKGAIYSPPGLHNTTLTELDAARFKVRTSRFVD